MATFDEWQRILSNPDLNPNNVSLADTLNAVNAPAPPTLLEKKQQSINAKLQGKSESLGLTPSSALSSRGGGSTGLVDLGQSSLFRAGGNLADVGRDVSNKLFGTEFDSSEETGYSNAQNADRATGVSSQYREQFVQDQDQVLKDVAGGNWLDAIGSTANVAVRTAADSFATVPELAAGAALTAVGGAGLAVVGRRLQKASETASNIAKRYEQIKDNKALDLVGKGLKESGKASVLTADIVQQQRNQFKAENNGEEMSSGRLAGSVLLTLATTIWQPSIASKFYKPKLKTTKADGEFKERLKKEAQSLLDTSNRGVMQNLALRVGEGIKGIAAAGGAEAVQEYAQFWAETLSVQMKPDEQTGFFKAALDVFTEEGNSDKAIQASFLGAGAGGVTKAAISTPTNAVGAVVDTATSVTNSAVRKSSQKINAALPDEDALSMTAQDRSRARAAGRVKRVNTKSIDTLSKVSSLNEIESTNEELLSRMAKIADGRNLNDQEVFQAVKKTAMKKLNTEIVASEISTTGKRVVGITTRAAESLKKRTEELATEIVTPQRMRKVKVFTEKTKRKITEEVKDFPNSTTMGLIELSGEYAANKSKETLSKLREKAQSIGPEYTRKIAESIKEDAPEVAAALNEAALKQENAAKESGTRNDNLTTEDNLSDSIQAARSIGKFTEDNIDISMNDVYDASFGQFDSEATVKKVQEAAVKIQNSSVFQSLPVEDQTAFKTVTYNLRKKIGPSSQSTVETVKAKTSGAIEKVTSTFDFIPTSKNPKEADSIKSKSLRAINSAFKTFTERGNDTDSNSKPFVIEYDGSVNTFNDDGTLIPVYQNPGDPKSKVVASIKKTQGMEQIRENMRTAIEADQNGEQTNSFDNTISVITRPEVVNAIAKQLKTNDPKVVQAVLTFFEPELATDKYLTNLQSKIETALKPETETESSSLANKNFIEFDENQNGIYKGDNIEVTVGTRFKDERFTVNVATKKSGGNLAIKTSLTKSFNTKEEATEYANKFASKDYDKTSKSKIKSPESRRKFREKFDSKDTNTDNSPEVSEDTEIEDDTFVRVTENNESYIVANVEMNSEDQQFLIDNIAGCK